MLFWRVTTVQPIKVHILVLKMRTLVPCLPVPFELSPFLNCPPFSGPCGLDLISTFGCVPVASVAFSELVSAVGAWTVALSASFFDTSSSWVDSARVWASFGSTRPQVFLLIIIAYFFLAASSNVPPEMVAFAPITDLMLLIILFSQELNSAFGSDRSESQTFLREGSWVFWKSVILLDSVFIESRIVSTLVLYSWSLVVPSFFLQILSPRTCSGSIFIKINFRSVGPWYLTWLDTGFSNAKWLLSRSNNVKDSGVIEFQTRRAIMFESTWL